MFWACSVSSGKTYDLKLAAKNGELLHVSHVILHKAGSEGTVTLFITLEKDKFPLAHLDLKHASANLDLYFEVVKGGVLSTEGKGEVSVLGYFEPNESEGLAKSAMIEPESDSEDEETQGKMDLDDDSEEEESIEESDSDEE